jgi:hypothetical protein
MELIKQPAFWAAHMWNVSRGPLADGDPDITDAAFGLSTDAIEAFYLRELSNELEWPYFHIPLRSGCAIEIEYANEPEDHQVVYRVYQKEWASSICVGKGGGHWQLPAFRWAELLEIGQAAVEGGERKSWVSASAMLLLLPSVWLTRDDNVDAIRRQLIEAWEKLNLVPHSQADFLAEQLITSSQNDVQWRCQERLGWVNDADNSTRNPASPGCLNVQEFSALLAFFNAVST